MKIIILNDYQRLSPRVKLEAQTLARKYRVEILNWNRGKDKRKAFKKNEIKYSWINFKAPLDSLAVIFCLPVLYWKIAKKLQPKQFDTIHCTHLILLPLAYLIGKKLKRKKVVYDVYERHAIEISYHFGIFSSVVKKTIEFLENQLVRRVDGILTVDSPDNFLKRRYKKCNKNTIVLYNVPSLDKTPSQSQIEKLRKKYEDNQVIAYVGGITKSKGAIKSIEATRIVKKEKPNIKLLLIGKLSDEEILGLLEKYQLKKNVELIPWLPYEEMLAYLKVADVGLAPHQGHKKFRYVSKGNGRKFFTYMQAGLPIVGPDFWEIGQVVREENCGVLVDTTKPEKIAEAILYLFKNPKEVKKMGRKGRKAIEEKYNWDIEKEKLLRGYKNIED